MNSSEYSIKAIFITKDRIISEKTFPKNISFGQIKKYFQNNISDGKTILFNKYFLNSKEITDSDIISQTFHSEQNTKILEISIAIELQESNESNQNQISSFNSEDHKELVYNRIILPKLNPFGLIVFFTKNKKIQFEKYPSNYLQNYGLNSSNLNLIYCNSPEALFLSGSVNTNSPSNDFWKINHQTYGIIRTKMPYEKRNHSMIYIPNLGELGSIFITGGDVLKKENFIIGEI